MTREKCSDTKQNRTYNAHSNTRLTFFECQSNYEYWEKPQTLHYCFLKCLHFNRHCSIIRRSNASDFFFNLYSPFFCLLNIPSRVPSVAKPLQDKSIVFCSNKFRIAIPSLSGVRFVSASAGFILPLICNIRIP